MTAENQVKPTDVDKSLRGTATYRSLGEQKLSAVLLGVITQVSLRSPR